MACTSPHHKELNDQGIGKCSKPMWCDGVPAGFCDRVAYGKPVRESGYVPALACSLHGGPTVRTFKDGDSWCAVKPGFINLEVSPAGFGDTREDAVKALLEVLS